MKRITLVVLLLASIGLAGCQTLKAHNPFRHREPPYAAAQQEQPLEVPPGMQQPPTREALAIPNVGSTAAPAAQTGTSESPPSAPVASAAGDAGTATATATPLTLADTPDSAYHRVGLALARGEAGSVTASDASAHTYQVAVDTTVTKKPGGGFIHRLFHRSKTEVVSGTVTVSVAPSGSGSVVEASGNPEAAAKVMSVLRQRLQ